MFWKRKKMVELGGSGYVYFNPDTGEEYARNHPVESGEVLEATLIRRSTPMEDALNDGLQYWLGLTQEQYKDIHRLQRENSKLLDEIAALRPDAEKYRERCRRDREHAENARVRKRAARKEAA